MSYRRVRRATVSRIVSDHCGSSGATTSTSKPYSSPSRFTPSEWRDRLSEGEMKMSLKHVYRRQERTTIAAPSRTVMIAVPVRTARSVVKPVRVG